MTHQLVKKTLVALLVTGTFSVGALAQAPSQRVPDPIDQIFKNKNDIAANKATLEKKQIVLMSNLIVKLFQG
ncbi:Uncharacterised protein [Aggregatibacter aphrophilus]|uniref:Uncharacterized protein n=1 Tax=Aggregatibacter aphrophilus TaxID=732 RepID=A0A336N1V0_AGGAP|nr:Uncharacterised protein [Aggregatibacter aphrophilus]